MPSSILSIPMSTQPLLSYIGHIYSLLSLIPKYIDSYATIPIILDPHNRKVLFCNKCVDTVRLNLKYSLKHKTKNEKEKKHNLIIYCAYCYTTFDLVILQRLNNSNCYSHSTLPFPQCCMISKLIKKRRKTAQKFYNEIALD